MFSFKLNRPGRGDEADAASDEVSDTASAAESAANEGPEAAEPKAAEPEVAGPDANLAARGETAWDPTRGDEESAKMTPSVDDARKQQDNAGNPEGPEKGLISEETQKAASASLSALLAATRKPEEPAANGEIDSSRTLEDVVRDALSPHLREWLDSNLPPIIEGEVRREVRRLVKQVEQSLD